MQKNIASQRFYVYAYDTVAEAPKTGDAANITAQISKDAGASAATNDVNPTELDAVDHPGVYYFNALQAETNADDIIVTPVSSTADVILDPVAYFTRPAYFPSLGIESDGDLTKVNTLDGHTAQTADHTAGIAAIPTTPMRGTDNAALASVATEARLAELDAANLPTDVAAIPTTPMRGTDNAALATVATEARLAELDAGNLPSGVDNIITSTGPTLLDKLQGYFQLALRSDAGLETDRATELADINADEGSGAGVYSSASNSAAETSGDVNTILGQVVSGDHGLAALKALIDALNDLTSSEVGDAVLDEVFEGTTTLRQALRLFASALYGKINGAETTTVNIRDEADTKNRIVATVDADGNRDAVTLNKT